MAYLGSNQFTWVPETRTFVAEVSTLGRFEMVPVYPDACDRGFTLISARTGREITFVETGVDTDGEDVAGWRFSPTPQCIRLHPECAGVSVLIIND